LSEATYDVVAIGNAIVDVLSHTDDAFIVSEGMTKGSMQLMFSPEDADALYAKMGPGIEASGGSAANTVAGIAALGGRCGFIGQVADDPSGGGQDQRPVPADEGGERLLGQPHLHEPRRVQRRLRLLEGAHDAVTGRLDHASAELEGGIAQQAQAAVDPGERLAVAQLLVQPRATADIGKQYCAGIGL